MNAAEIILIIISGLGVIHGIFLGLILLNYSKGKRLTNTLLGILLFVLSFRVGKSVFLEFTQNIDVKVIFIGLSAIMAIGPLFLLVIKSATSKSFRIEWIHYLQFLPFFSGLIFGSYISTWDQFPNAFLIFIFLCYYGHLLTYLFIGFRLILNKQKENPNISGIQFLKLLFYSLLAIWFVYVLNLFDDIIPYIIGPILYSVIAYVVSFIVFKKGYIEQIGFSKYQTNPVSSEQSELLFSRIQNLIESERLFADPELSLKVLSKLLNISPQIVSLVVNQKSGGNFNSFINSYRITEAEKLLASKNHEHLTIAAIAYEAGFNSISSFNTAFKKKNNITPLTYRNSISK